MLRPQDGPTRESTRLDGVWRFRADPDGTGRDAAWSRGVPDAGRMPVPSSYGDVLPGSGLRQHVGDVWYEREVWVPSGWRGRRVLLRFDAAAHEATVWVNGVEVARHVGGYLPFEADVTDAAPAGEPARVVVRVGNELTLATIPPGVVETTASGRRQRYFHDFLHYSGLHRSVWLSAVPPVRFDTLDVATELAPTGRPPTGEPPPVERATGEGGPVARAARRDATVRVRAGVAGDASGAVVTAVLLDADEREVARDAGDAGAAIELAVPDAHPWAPGDGYRYLLRLELRDAAGDLLDAYATRVGIRTVRVDGARLLVNDVPVRLRGFGRHEDHPVRGKGHDDVLAVHDHELLGWFGANSFRTSHYPYAEEVLDLADEDGLLVISESPAVGQNAVFSGGRLGAETFGEGPDLIGADAQAAHARVLRELVARDALHPSVIAWSIANEPASSTDAAERYFAPLVDLVRELDPSRPVTFANETSNRPGRCRVTPMVDLLLVNRYLGWYVDTGDLVSAEEHLRAELAAWAELGKPIVVSEFGADAVAGVHHLDPEPWSEEYQRDLVAMSTRVFDTVPAVIGEHVWNLADFATAPGLIRVDGNRKGVLTRQRQPKAAAWALRERWRAAAERERAAATGRDEDHRRNHQKGSDRDRPDTP
ncbi:MAG: hypothetical protein BGO96_15215 [Micrococcales bacterium 73-15]|uniref:glycoside hydrolase family 2 TIM barrel-domain containing protein n=1 Tax=Salana multivorans TaxID=120377 RepID=UPI0009609DAA|nr:glycoside hydrolase family 2 TIM barrel-domain containing protein [Salana multivorans]OJX94269.1 MAG: hypothetical protein BGO96_15215 [Micrococcales bacterium 73-15]